MSAPLNPGWSLMIAHGLNPHECRLRGKIRGEITSIYAKKNRPTRLNTPCSVLIRSGISIITKILCVANHR